MDQTPSSSKQDNGMNGLSFWAIFAALSFTNLLAGLEGSIAATALPSVVSDLQAGDNYVWIVNGYMLTYTAFLPLIGQASSVLGRRWPTIGSIAIFILGSSISGGALSTSAIIAGRLIQGIGAAGVTALTQVIVSDLVSVRDRGSYIGLVYAVAGVGSALGPPAGGTIVQYGSWRWIFWLSVPIGVVSLVLHFFFLHIVAVKKDGPLCTLKEKIIGGIDWVGNFILVGSVISTLVALSWANTRYPWSSWHIILPLVFGFLGMAAFFAYEGSTLFNRLCPYGSPTMPPRMFANRTSCAALISTFLAAMLTMWRIYFVPVYLQSVLLESPTRSGVLLLPTMLVGMPVAIISGQVLSRFGRYKPIHVFGFAVATLASGLYINFNRDSSLAKVVLYQIVAAIGGGCLLTTMLTAVQASHPPADMVAATSTWTFMQAFGGVWGLTIPAVIFNSQFDSRISTITSEAVRETLGGGDAYSHVSASYTTSLAPFLRTEVIEAYLGALKIVWVACLGFNALGAVLVLFEREITLSETVESDYGIKKENDGVQLESLTASI
ncbi:major facilitator superfamily-domain-containing protein [Diaporthe sp. PMI_573]|nr:major facilitator superfamily-domain-containing protein [Diaporthaceae sp. PMI_573]